MLGYPYIEALFKAILSQSMVMQGRFHVCPHFGSELNTTNLEDVLKATMDDYKQKEYPLAIMLPPHSSGYYTEENIRDSIEIVMYFLSSTYRTRKNQIQSINPDSLVSTHRIIYDWHDMKRCAISFLKVLQGLSVGNPFNISDREKQRIDPITTIGNDAVSGVMVSFTLNINELCELEDYPADFETKITLPDASDLHPEHLH